MLVAGTAWLLPPPATNGAPVLAMPPASEAPAAPVPERSDATVFSERERVAPETEQAAVAQALSYAQKLEAAQDEFDHTYVGFVGEVERRLSSRRIEPLIDAALRCEHPRCPRFVARFVSQPTRKPHSFLKALERRIERDATMQVVARQRLRLVECARWALEDREDIVDPGAQQHIRSVLDAHEATARGEMPEEGPSHEELQFQQRVQVLMDE